MGKELSMAPAATPGRAASGPLLQEVLLGLPGPWAADRREPASHYATKIGGLPDWPAGASVSDGRASLVCGACGHSLVLVAQAYAPLALGGGAHFDERTLYVLGCGQAGCGVHPSSWTALRLQARSKEGEAAEPAEAVEPTQGTSSDPSLQMFARPLDADDSRTSPSPASASMLPAGKDLGLPVEGAAWHSGSTGSGFKAMDDCAWNDTSIEDGCWTTPPWPTGIEEGEDGRLREEATFSMRELTDALVQETALAAASQSRRQASSRAKRTANSTRARGGDSACHLNEASSSRRSASEMLGESAFPSEPITLRFHRSDESSKLIQHLAALPCFYIYSVTEPSAKSSVSASSDCLQARAARGGLGKEEEAPGEAWEGEVYEHDQALTADRSYLRFKKRLDRSPEQCLRYAFQGEPVWPGAQAVPPPPPCPLCGAPRVFELQLMPPLVYFLEEAMHATDAIGPESWKWSTLAVFTCSQSCIDTTAKKLDSRGGLDWYAMEELILMQSE
eukprot:SM000069S20683  [mRNA]  locus=s69:112422:115512:- [translate_table: standard]